VALRTSFLDVHERIARSAESVGRDPASVTLIAVSKTVCVDLIREAYDLGHRDFGESRLQEAIPKIERLPDDIRWHFIGKLQSNKARRAADLFHVIHTLESEQQLRELSKAGRAVDGLIEVNIGVELQKSGISPESLGKFAKTVVQYPLVRLRGLMTVGPLHPNAEFMRPFFRELRELGYGFKGQWLSMGMSNDFEVAIQEGSTHVRVGSALFGARS
jgi:pyridoxal phosphate enzyme (YggS family)